MAKKKHRSSQKPQARSASKLPPGGNRAVILQTALEHANSRENRAKMRDYIKQCGSPIVAAKGVFIGYAEEVNREPKNGLSIECKPGCWYCCMMPVAATAFEAAMAFVAIQKLPEEDRQRIFQRLEEHVLLQRDAIENSPIKRADFSRQCPLLANDGRCSIYDSRPLTCRGVLSTDAERCRRAFVEGDDGNPNEPFQVMSNVINAAIPQLMIALNEGNLDHYPNYELASSIYALWKDDTLFDRWEKGKHFAKDGFPHMAELGEVFPTPRGLSIGRPKR